MHKRKALKFNVLIMSWHEEVVNIKIPNTVGLGKARSTQQQNVSYV